jgi:hypothetical protein
LVTVMRAVADQHHLPGHSRAGAALRASDRGPQSDPAASGRPLQNWRPRGTQPLGKPDSPSATLPSPLQRCRRRTRGSSRCAL